jgi:hypothetical protein
MIDHYEVISHLTTVYGFSELLIITWVSPDFPSFSLLLNPPLPAIMVRFAEVNMLSVATTLEHQRFPRATLTLVLANILVFHSPVKS